MGLNAVWWKMDSRENSQIVHCSHGNVERSNGLRMQESGSRPIPCMSVAAHIRSARRELSVGKQRARYRSQRMLLHGVAPGDGPEGKIETSLGLGGYPCCGKALAISIAAFHKGRTRAAISPSSITYTFSSVMTEAWTSRNPQDRRPNRLDDDS
jgi:hypothetical protein